MPPLPRIRSTAQSFSWQIDEDKKITGLLIPVNAWLLGALVELGLVPARFSPPPLCHRVAMQLEW